MSPKKLVSPALTAPAFRTSATTKAKIIPAKAPATAPARPTRKAVIPAKSSVPRWIVATDAKARLASVQATAVEYNGLVQRVDMALVASKYIGETEKALSVVLAQAAQSGATLFFDEADALFGRRSEVKDSHDRYANTTVAYLLESAERLGVKVIVGSKVAPALDPDLLRRWETVSLPTKPPKARVRVKTS